MGKPSVTTGHYFYDAKHNGTVIINVLICAATLITRVNGKHDRYCGTVKRQDTPCQHLVTDGRRWLVFPEANYCCMCCTAERGCGILKRDWLQDATFIGT